MNVARPSLTSLAILALSASAVLAQDKPSSQPAPQAIDSLETLKKEFNEARDAHVTQLRAAFEEARKMGMRRTSSSTSASEVPISRRASWRSPRKTPRARRRSTPSR